MYVAVMVGGAKGNTQEVFESTPPPYIFFTEHLNSGEWGGTYTPPGKAWRMCYKRVLAQTGHIIMYSYEGKAQVDLA